MSLRRGISIIALGMLAACARIAPPPPPPPQLPPPPVGESVSFRRDVRPILDRRCVVCHACNDAPCQLLLSSSAGIERGASKAVVYDTERLRAAPPTRLFIDAQTTAGWRGLGFFPVAGDPGATGADAASLLAMMLGLGHAHPFAADQPLPAAVELDIERPLTCAQAREFAAYAEAQPLGGMPYGAAPLSAAELGVLAAWVGQGAPVDTTAPALPAAATAQVASWESFLNGD